MGRTAMKWLPLLLVVVCGCAAAPAGSARSEGLERWVGRPLDDLVNTWGAPPLQAEAEGLRVFSWPATRFGQRSLPANLAPVYPATVAGTLEDYRCRAAVTVDDSDRIVAAEWRGDECFNP